MEKVAGNTPSSSSPNKMTQPLVVIVGETASGKSSLAITMAERFNGEVISADSWSVYEGFDIGTAKPDSSEQAGISHHLLDVAKPEDGFNAVLYKEQANTAIRGIHAKNKLPIIAGGTGLYIDAVIYDFEFLPTSTERGFLDGLSLDDLLGLAKKRGIDLSGVDIRNKRRVVRAIEAKGKKPQKKELRSNTLVLGIRNDREELRQRINARVQAMIDQGLEQEVQRLSAQLGWNNEAMKGIGYWQWKNYFEGNESLESVQQRIIQATLGLAKRQRTWFKKNTDIEWIESAEHAEELITKFLNK